MKTISYTVKAYWNTYAAILIVPLLAAVVSLSYFIVKSDDFLTTQSQEIPAADVLPEILSGHEYIQKIYSEKDGLNKISVFLAIYGRVNHSNVYISLSDDTGKLIKEWKLKSSLLKDNSYRTLSLDRRQENSCGNVYYLTLKSDANAGNGVTAYTGTSSQGLSLNGEKLDKTLCYRLTYRQSFGALFSKANGFHAACILILAYIIFTLLPRLSKIRIEHTFLVVWSSISLMYLFSAPLFSVPDEQAHLTRSYEISYGYLISDVNEQTLQIGRELPLDLDLSPIGKNWQSFSDSSDLQVSRKFVFIDFHNVAVYSPVTYIPQAIGIFIARHMTDNLSVIIYSGRVSNWLLITLILYIAMRIIPVGKEIVALIALLPMNIHEAVSLAPDGLVVAVSILMVSAVMYLRHCQKNRIKLWQYFVLFLLAWVISQLKLVYLPFILIYVLLPDALFGSRKRKWFCLIVIGFLAVASNLIWLSLCSKFLVHNGSDLGANLAYIFDRPLSYIVALARTFFNLGSYIFDTMVGSSLAWLNVPVPEVLVHLYLCVIGYKFWNSRRQFTKAGLYESGVYGATVLSIILLIATSEYLYWTEPYANIVYGIQGRYLIPQLLPLYFTMNGYLSTWEPINQKLSVNIMSFITCINFCACTALLFHFISL